MDNSPWPLGRLLETARIDRGLSTKEAARRAGISDTLWRTLERGFELKKGTRFPASPRPETVVKAARIADIDPKTALALAGLPTVDPAEFEVLDLAGVSDEQLLDEVRRRMQLRTSKRTLSAQEMAAEPNRFGPAGSPSQSPAAPGRAPGVRAT